MSTSWIGLDWGTTNLRAFAINEVGKVLDERISNQGMDKLSPHEFEYVLLTLIGDWLNSGCQIPVYACGMVGSQQGWIEAEYREVPCKPVKQEEMTFAPSIDQRIKVYILPGLSQSIPCNIMRGEETQIAGFLYNNKNFSGTVCLPGTHSKWAIVRNGQVLSFSSFMTGELFSIISKHSVLRHSLLEDGWNHEDFLEASKTALSEPQIVFTNLFGVRAASLLSGQTSQEARARLSGMLIGAELGLTRCYWQNKPVAIIGAENMVSLYGDILASQGNKVINLDAKLATLSGLAIAAGKKLER